MQFPISERERLQDDLGQVVFPDRRSHGYRYTHHPVASGVVGIGVISCDGMYYIGSGKSGNPIGIIGICILEDRLIAR